MVKLTTFAMLTLPVYGLSVSYWVLLSEVAPSANTLSLFFLLSFQEKNAFQYSRITNRHKFCMTYQIVFLLFTSPVQVFPLVTLECSGSGELHLHVLNGLGQTRMEASFDQDECYSNSITLS